MQPKHVKEAFRLLNKSIIRVETPDIQFDDENEEGKVPILAAYIKIMAININVCYQNI